MTKMFRTGEYAQTTVTLPTETLKDLRLASEATGITMRALIMQGVKLRLATMDTINRQAA